MAIINLERLPSRLEGALSSAAREYLSRSAKPKAATHFPPVQTVGLTFSATETAFVSINFDIRAAREPYDGWTHEAYGELLVAEWGTAFARLEREDVSLRLPTGEVLTATRGNEEQWAIACGRFLESVLASASATALLEVFGQRRIGRVIENVEGFFEAYRG